MSAPDNVIPIRGAKALYAGARDLPLGNDLHRTIDQLRAIAKQASDSLVLSDGPVNPDWRLLDLTAEVLHMVSRDAKIRDKCRDHPGRCYDGAAGLREEYRALDTESHWLTGNIRSQLRAAAKMKATTPAGIYAKALLCRVSITGAATLAKSLADELIECEGLRASLWPVETQT